MLGYFGLCILFSVQYSIVRCVIPALNVQKLDQNLIKKTRQDTLEMCRIFTSENGKLEKYGKLERNGKIEKPSRRKKAAKQKIQPTRPNKYRRRIKRSVGPEVAEETPRLKLEDMKRVEDIVDKLYDDNNNDFENPVTYRKLDLDSLTTKHYETGAVKGENTSAPNLLESGRRLNFRPALLTGPLAEGPGLKTSVEAHSYIAWPKIWKHGIVPYFIDPKTYDSHLSETIINAFDYFEKATCIRLQKLREKPIDKFSMHAVEWVYITNPSGIKQCVHSNEKKVNKGVQMVVFGYDCMSTGEILHEVMHVLGFPHEHTRPDRDRHLAVMWDNIKPGYKKYFEMREEDTLMSLNLPYDYASVLHYPARAFSKNGQMTLVAQGGVQLGQREALSETDVAKVSLIYGSECVNRNKQYLQTTCPSVVKSAAEHETKPTQQEIDNYFRNRLWPYGVVNYKLRDPMEFSAEERENIKAVIDHIEKETCIEFRDLTEKREDQSCSGDESEKDTLSDVESVETNNSPTDKDYVESVDTNNSPIDKDSVETNNSPSDKDSTKENKTSNEEFPITTDPVNATPLYFNSSVSGFPELIRVLDNTDTDDDLNNENELMSLQSESDEKTEMKFSKYVNFNRKPLQRSEVTRGPRAADDDRLNKGNDLGNQRLETDENVVMSIVKNDETTDELADETPKQANRLKREAPKLPIPPSPHRRHANSILILKRSSRSGCVCPPPGKVDGDAGLEISTDCFNTVNDLLHVFVHVLGLDHQHNSHDRDNYLRIFWDNMTEEVKAEFQRKLPPAASMGFPYDYHSVTHYPWLGIKNGTINLMYPVWNDGWSMGHWQGLSSTDVEKINLLYNDQCMERKKHL